MTETERAIEIIEARLPLYTDIGQINALRECISSIRSASRPAEAGKPVVKGLDDSALVKLMYKHLPPKVADDLTIDKHPPMFPQAEYSVPTLSARNFVDALLSALSTPADRES